VPHVDAPLAEPDVHCSILQGRFTIEALAMPTRGRGSARQAAACAVAARARHERVG
jgi:hypothetical protein